MNFSNQFTENLPSDVVTENYVRLVQNCCFSYVEPTKTKFPKLIHYSNDVLKILGLNNDVVDSKSFLEIFSGNQVHKTSRPYAMAYAGHQFGQWAGQLGDGRAIGLGELNNFQVQLKGAGKTPYSRNADGLAVLRSSIREHLCSEAMHYLGIPTTRSLSIIQTGDLVLRDMMYDGNPKYEKGAVVCRVAPSFIRFGNFELLSAQNDIENLRKLIDYSIQHYYPELLNSTHKYIDFFRLVVQKTRELVLDWQRVGFVHGVMNTDNMSIHGITIDYGPYGWVDDYDTNWTPNTTDAHGKRYCYGNQPSVALWNLFQLANSIYPLVNEAKPFEEILQEYSIQFEVEYTKMMLHKLGLFNSNDEKIIQQLLINFEEAPVDMTIFFRELGQISKTNSIEKSYTIIESSFYDKTNKSTEDKWLYWIEMYHNLLKQEVFSDDDKMDKMNLLNPKYVFRNYIAQLVIEDADKGNYQLLNEVFEMLKFPYSDQPKFDKWYAKRPDWAKNKVGCSMLSCSS